MQFLFQPLNHLRPIRRWAARSGASVHLSADDFSVRLTLGAQAHALLPRFVISSPAGLAYTDRFVDEGTFAGWSPYRLKRWPLAQDKLEFKHVFQQAGITVPQRLDAPPADGDLYLVKARAGSFGHGVRGPYGRGSVEPPGAAAAPGDYRERFISGRTAKCWFWNERPVAAEVIELPHLIGDGSRSVAQLLGTPRGSFDRSYPLDDAVPLLESQGLHAGSVPEPGRRVLLSCKYASPYHRLQMLDRDKWPTLPAAIQQQIRCAGAVAWRAIPPALRDHTMFTLDAVIDGGGTAWFLEMNSHPMVHPATYAAMLDDLFAVEGPAATGPAVAAHRSPPAIAEGPQA